MTEFIKKCGILLHCPKLSTASMPRVWLGRAMDDGVLELLLSPIMLLCSCALMALQ